MGVSSRHRWHDTFCGGVIDPRRPHFVYDYEISWPFMICVYLSCEQGACMFMYVCMGGVWMHPSAYVYVWL